MRTVATYAACIIATYIVMAVLAALAGPAVAWAALLGFTAGALSVNHLWEYRVSRLLHSTTEVSP